MKVIIKCDCGNQVEINPETFGNVAYITHFLVDNDFFYDVKIEPELQQEVVTDPDDVDAELKEIDIRCRKCGEFITLNF